eukprot:g23148.t1
MTIITIEFTLQFERVKLESDVIVLQLSKVEDTSSSGAEVGVVTITNEKELGKLKVDKSRGLYGLHPEALKEIAEEIVETLVEGSPGIGGGPEVYKNDLGLKSLSYEERLRTLGLFLMEFRRM